MVSRELAPEMPARVRDFLDTLDRQWPGARRGVELRLAGWTVEEISDDLRVNLRFLERLSAKLRRCGWPL